MKEIKRCESICNSNSEENEITIQCQLDHGHIGNHKFDILDDQGEIYETIKW